MEAQRLEGAVRFVSKDLTIAYASSTVTHLFCLWACVLAGTVRCYPFLFPPCPLRAYRGSAQSGGQVGKCWKNILDRGKAYIGLHQLVLPDQGPTFISLPELGTGHGQGVEPSGDRGGGTLLKDTQGWTGATEFGGFLLLGQPS